MVPYFQPVLSVVGDEQRQIILELADQICHGKIPFLSYETRDLGMSPPWNQDFISGKEWPMAPSPSLTAIRLDGSDVKVPWELSRLQFLPVLGKAYCLTKKSIYRESAKRLVDDWISRNPVGQGVNWMIAMEAALRALSILFLLNLLWPLSDGENDTWLGRVTESLWQHLVYIEGNLEFSHIVRGNHYLSNLVGLYGLAVFLDGPAMERRRRRYRMLLEREILLHVYEDGGNYEASSGYHVLVTQIFLTAYQLMRAEGAMPSNSFVERLRRMFVWMQALADAEGRLPHIGDCDDGRVEFLFDDLKQMASFPVTTRDSLRVSSLLGSGRLLLKAPVGGCGTDAAWYGFADEQNRDDKQDVSEQGLKTSILPQSGIALARRGRHDLIFLALPNGIHGKGTHTHNDKLSIVLRVDGDEILCDPGTGCYTRDREMRDRFRSARAHNTALVDGQEQNRIPASRMNFFSLGNEAKIDGIYDESSPEKWRVRAAHSGYADQGVIHSRSVEWPDANHVQIEDHFSGSGRHRLEAGFHAGPGWLTSTTETQRRGEELKKQKGSSGIHESQGANTSVNSAEEGLVRCSFEKGGKRFDLVFRAPCNIRIQQETTAASWVYGTTVSTDSVRMMVEAELPTSFITTISWND